MKKKMMRKKWESNKKLTKAIHSHENQDLHVDEEIEIQAEGESYRKTSPLRKLRAGLKMCGLGRGKNKQEAWAKLVHYYIHFAENLSTELARKEFQKSKADEGESARGQVVPRVPSKSERQAHELTRWPYQDWYEHCVAARNRIHASRTRTL